MSRYPESLKSRETIIQYYVTKEEFFSIIFEIHTRIGHGRRTYILKHLQVKYQSTTFEVLKLYLNLCKQCEMKQSAPKKSIVMKPQINSELE